MSKFKVGDIVVGSRNGNRYQIASVAIDSYDMLNIRTGYIYKDQDTTGIDPFYDFDAVTIIRSEFAQDLEDIINE